MKKRKKEIESEKKNEKVEKKWKKKYQLIEKMARIDVTITFYWKNKNINCISAFNCALFFLFIWFLCNWFLLNERQWLQLHEHFFSIFGKFSYIFWAFFTSTLWMGKKLTSKLSQLSIITLYYLKYIKSHWIRAAYAHAHAHKRVRPERAW